MHPDVKKFINIKNINDIMDDLYQKLNKDMNFSNLNMLTMMDLIKISCKMSITLPVDMMMDQIKETELCTRYIQPALQPLFDDNDKNILFKWFGTQNSESKNANMTISRRRLDCTISNVEDNYEKASIRFGEVKQCSESNNHRNVNKDLIRLGIFSKKSIDVNHATGILTMHIVGNIITFYLTQLMNDGLYTMLELTNFSLPLSMKDTIIYERVNSIPH